MSSGIEYDLRPHPAVRESGGRHRAPETKPEPVEPPAWAIEHTTQFFGPGERTVRLQSASVEDRTTKRSIPAAPSVATAEVAVPLPPRPVSLLDRLRAFFGRRS